MAETSKTTDQALSVLVLLSENGPMTTTAVTRSLGINRTVVHRLLTTLHKRGFVNRHDDGYVPGAILLRIAGQVEPELRAAARAVLAGIAANVGETIVLHVASGGDAVVLDQVVDRKHVLRVEHQIGSRHPIQIGASGRALLAFLPPETIERALAGSDDGPAARAELQSIRESGYATSHDELQQGVHGLAVPVLDGRGHVIASLALIVPTTRTAGLARHVDELIAGASQIARSLTSSYADAGAGAGAG